MQDKRSTDLHESVRNDKGTGQGRSCDSRSPQDSTDSESLATETVSAKGVTVGRDTTPRQREREAKPGRARRWSERAAGRRAAALTLLPRCLPSAIRGAGAADQWREGEMQKKRRRSCGE